MNWQEYQEAVALLYEKAEGIGDVKRNAYIPDKDTGQKRQIDLLIEIASKGHVVRIVVDAKFHKDKIDVKEVESVLALAAAVQACKAVIVSLNGWTEPAEIKASTANLDLRILDIEDALDILEPDNWCICPQCLADCILADASCFNGLDQPFSLAVIGQCRSCREALIWCWDCGLHEFVSVGQSIECSCGHLWDVKNDDVYVSRYSNED